MSKLTEFTVTDLRDNPYDLAQHQGKVVLIVNTASKCGLTGQYEGLEELHRTYGERGLVILGFPCNQFAGQEPGSSEEIGGFCKLNYGVTFPIMEKVAVNGDGTAPIFTWLKARAGGFLGTSIKWNFTKFLVARDGVTVRRFAPTTKPKHLIKAIEAALQS